jgi:hypothetical protein
MKKLFLALVAALTLSATSFAQTPQTAPAQTPAASTTTKQPAAATTTHLKKDGTPDKRYKENKTPKTGPTKKDGTPDKRFKSNKTATPAATTAPATKP